MSKSTQNRLKRDLASLATNGRKGLLPYVTAGLPDLTTTEQILNLLADLGVTAVELGFPYSDMSRAQLPICSQRRFDLVVGIEPTVGFYSNGFADRNLRHSDHTSLYFNLNCQFPLVLSFSNSFFQLF